MAFILFCIDEDKFYFIQKLVLNYKIPYCYTTYDLFLYL